MKPDGITDRPVPPWELPGAFCRDGEPHRADWLCRVGRAGCGAALFAWVISLPITFAAVSDSVRWRNAKVSAALVVLFALPGLLLGITAMAQARRDLGLMLRGMMDPSGRGRTADAAVMGRDAVVFSLIICGAAVALLLLALRRG
jgi:ABC-type dipeptide/oligopeptide/nickel transport system permease component